MVIEGAGKMKELEMALVCFINEFHKRNLYQCEKYQMLHGVKYKKEMVAEHLEEVRSAYRGNCFEAAYELKTYYMENGILSNTIVLKMRPESPEIQELRTIKIKNELDGSVKEYSHHAIEIFKEHGKYKVLDILHNDKAVWLEEYLDDVCGVNNCKREQLRYDMGYLAPAHVYANNMQELSDVMRYLDKQYKIGKPRLNLVDTDAEEEDWCLLSDDMMMNFDRYGAIFGVSGIAVIRAYQKIYDKLMGIRFNALHILCLGRIMRDPFVSGRIEEKIFDSEWVCQMLEER